MHGKTNSRSTELRDVIFMVAVVLVLMGLLTAFAFADTPKKEEPLAPYGCAWIDCRPDSGGKMQCNGPRYGSHLELVDVIQTNSHGAVSYECGPGKGEKK